MGFEAARKMFNAANIKELSLSLGYEAKSLVFKGALGTVSPVVTASMQAAAGVDVPLSRGGFLCAVEQSCRGRFNKCTKATFSVSLSLIKKHADLLTVLFCPI